MCCMLYGDAAREVEPSVRPTAEGRQFPHDDNDESMETTTTTTTATSTTTTNSFHSEH